MFDIVCFSNKIDVFCLKNGLFQNNTFDKVLHDRFLYGILVPIRGYRGTGGTYLVLFSCISDRLFLSGTTWVPEMWYSQSLMYIGKFMCGTYGTT